MWPQLSALSYQRSQPEVKALCEKHGIPYTQESVWIRLKKTVDIMTGDATQRPYPPSYELQKDLMVWNSNKADSVSPTSATPTTTTAATTTTATTTTTTTRWRRVRLWRRSTRIFLAMRSSRRRQSRSSPKRKFGSGNGGRLSMSWGAAVSANSGAQARLDGGAGVVEVEVGGWDVYIYPPDGGYTRAKAALALVRTWLVRGRSTRAC